MTNVHVLKIPAMNHPSKQKVVRSTSATVTQRMSIHKLTAADVSTTIFCSTGTYPYNFPHYSRAYMYTAYMSLGKPFCFSC